MKENQHLGLGNNKYVKRLKNNMARQSKPRAKKMWQEIGRTDRKMK